jgi:hypothetical protein
MASYYAKSGQIVENEFFRFTGVGDGTNWEVTKTFSAGQRPHGYAYLTITNSAPTDAMLLGCTPPVYLLTTETLAAGAEIGISGSGRGQNKMPGDQLAGEVLVAVDAAVVLACLFVG